MTISEFSVEFDILYNNVSSNQAPGLNEYEKSVYLTLAQDEVVRSIYTGFNITRESLEETESKRKQLSQLIMTETLTDGSGLDITNPNYHIMRPDGLISYTATLPSDVLFIIYERAKFEDKGEDCKYDGKQVEIYVLNHDEYNRAISNPFRRPNHRKIWRLDISNNEATGKLHELVTDYELEAYQIRYVKEPSPIILVNLNTVFTADNLSIKGETDVMNCELNDGFHIDILNRAVELAIRDYKENSLQAKIQTNQRLN